MRVLGIETSCDETGIAVVEGEGDATPRLLAQALHSQVEMHADYGGVVPELASRDHIRRVLPLTREVLGAAGADLDSIDVIAYTRGPGLAGIFLLAAVAYFLTYETLHALYHLPVATLNRLGIGRWRLFRALQAHHTHHHVLGRMAHVNFNVTIPLMDVVLGTKERGD